MKTEASMRHCFHGSHCRIKMLILSIKCRNELSHIGVGENWFKLFRKET